MIYNRVSANVIIAKLIRDLGLENSDFVSDAIEWMQEAIEFIGYHAGYEPQEALLEVESHRAPLPSNLYNLRGVFTSDGNKLPYGGMYSRNKDLFDESYSDPSCSLTGTKGIENLDQNRIKNLFSPPDFDYYIIKPSYIHTSFEDGTIRILFNGYPLDGSGYPMIPDEINYKSAIEFYIMSRLAMRGHKFPDPSFNFQFLEYKFKVYGKDARAKAKYPNIDKASRFGNMWTRLIPSKFNDYDDMYDFELANYPTG